MKKLDNAKAILAKHDSNEVTDALQDMIEAFEEEHRVRMVLTDGLLNAVKANPRVAWVNVDLRFRDRNTGEVRYAPDQVVAMLMDAPNQVLFQDQASGTHRMVALQHIEGVRTA